MHIKQTLEKCQTPTFSNAKIAELLLGESLALFTVMIIITLYLIPNAVTKLHRIQEIINVYNLQKIEKPQRNKSINN